VARSNAVVWALVLALQLGACQPAQSEKSRCSLAPAHVIARAEAPQYESVALAADPTRAVAAYSSRDGLFVRALDGRGAPLGAAVRVAEPCASVDVELSAEHVLLACLRRHDDALEDESEAPQEQGALLYALDAALHTEWVRTLGRAGPEGRGIDLETDGQRVYVLHHDGSRGLHMVRLVTLHGEKQSERVLSRPGRVASEPALTMVKGELYATWTENELLTLSNQKTELLIAHGDGPAQVLRSVRVLAPAPQLAHDARGLVLLFRDQAAQDRRAELYLARLNKQLELAEKPHKIGRANTDGPPSLHACGSAEQVALLPREYGGEHYIAIHTLGGELQNITGGHQFYGNSRDYVRSAGACMGNDVLLLAAERKTPADRGVEISAMRFACK
jgi:hypothetical protein